MANRQAGNEQDRRDAEKAYYDQADIELKNINRYDSRTNRRHSDVTGDAGESNENDSCWDKVFQWFFIGVAVVSYFS